MTVNDTVKRWSPFVKLALGLALAGGMYWVGFLHGRSETNAELRALYDPLVKELVAARDRDRQLLAEAVAERQLAEGERQRQRLEESRSQLYDALQQLHAPARGRLFPLLPESDL